MDAMQDYKKQIDSFSKEYRQIIARKTEQAKEHIKNELPGNTYFLTD